MVDINADKENKSIKVFLITKICEFLIFYFLYHLSASCNYPCITGVPIGSNTDPLCFELPIPGDKCCANVACFGQPTSKNIVLIIAETTTYVKSDYDLDLEYSD